MVIIYTIKSQIGSFKNIKFLFLSDEKGSQIKLPQMNVFKSPAWENTQQEIMTGSLKFSIKTQGGKLEKGQEEALYCVLSGVVDIFTSLGQSPQTFFRTGKWKTGLLRQRGILKVEKPRIPTHTLVCLEADKFLLFTRIGLKFRKQGYTRSRCSQVLAAKGFNQRWKLKWSQKIYCYWEMKGEM